MAEGAPGPVPIPAGVNGSELEQPAAWRLAMGLQAQCPSLELIICSKNNFCTSSFDFKVQKLIQSRNKAPLQLL